jgi:hypothetical protein
VIRYGLVPADDPPTTRRRWSRLGEAPPHSTQLPSPHPDHRDPSPVLSSLRTFIAATSGPVASVAATSAHIIIRHTHGLRW